MNLDVLANALYVACVQPDTTWWDDLPTEMQDGWRRAARAALRMLPGVRVNEQRLAVLERATAIGYISWEGDSWYAKDAGYGYDEAEATLREAQRILRDVGVELDKLGTSPDDAQAPGTGSLRTAAQDGQSGLAREAQDGQSGLESR